MNTIYANNDERNNEKKDICLPIFFTQTDPVVAHHNVKIHRRCHGSDIPSSPGPEVCIT